MTGDKKNTVALAGHSCSGPRVARRAFTLIELLVVISVMAVLAALTVPVIGAIKKKAIINHARGEMAQLEAAIDRYKAAYGFYPPDGSRGPVTNELYYELVGTTNRSSTADFQVLGSTNAIDYAAVSGTFGIQGFMNCDKSGGGEDTRPAQNFFPEIPPTELASSGAIKVFATSVGGPLENYAPMPGFTTSGGGNANPWRYVSSHPRNNPNSYDLWVQIVFKPGVTNLICNWNDRPIINSPMP